MKKSMCLLIIAVSFLSGCTSPVLEAKKSVVRIEVQGTHATFKDNENRKTIVTKEINGGGSGVFISENEILTNTHVLAGASVVSVFIDSQQEPLVGEILGISECSDLGIIKVPGKHPFLKFGNKLDQGTVVTALGYPLDSLAESAKYYTIKEGTISKDPYLGSTESSSVEVVEHSAVLNPGNSGGPLVNSSGEIVGINEIKNSNTNQYFAITPRAILEVLDDLKAGKDGLGLGLNPEIVYYKDNDNIRSYMLAQYVKTGSIASKAGIRTGDIITSIEQKPMENSKNLGNYCSILAGKRNQPVHIQTYRQSTGESFEGDTDSKLALVSSPLPAQTQNPPQQKQAQALAYVEIADPAKFTSASVPSTWSDIITLDWTFNDKIIGKTYSASENSAKFDTNFGINGIKFYFTKQKTPNQFVKLFDNYPALCYDKTAMKPVSSTTYTGYAMLLDGCSVANTRVFIMAINTTANPSITIGMVIQANGQNKDEVYKKVIDSIRFN
jgi:serine protease Do